jgi:hypothetical protein
MRWTTKERPPAPKHDDTRLVKRFAWRPTKLSGDNKTVWLELYWQRQRFYEDPYGMDCWIDDKSYVMYYG